MNYINDIEKSLKFLVGMNGSGKTHALEEALKETKQKAFLITEDGMPVIPKYLHRVVIDFDRLKYNYADEESRGKIERETEEESISDRAQNVILYCHDIIGKLNMFKKKSKGQEKLYNMLNIFTNYNLNNLKIVYFDEPENFLDEEFLKVIAEFFGVLIENGFIVRVATHNSRLLNILKVDLEDIIFFHSHSQIVILNNEINELYRNTSNEIDKIRNKYKMQLDSSIKYKLELLEHSLAFDNFIEQNLKSEEFYRCLFYKQIIIVEGTSDIVALTSMKNEFESSIEFFNPNGKAFIPFFVSLFKKLKKEITVVIDDDLRLNEADTTLKHPVAITYYLKQLQETKQINLVVHSPDLEGFYDIDLNKIAEDLGMSNSVKSNNRGWHKTIAAFVFFRETGNMERLKNHILGTEDSSKFEFK
jgi:ABC-type multidrug transport system ATPase subunit